MNRQTPRPDERVQITLAFRELTRKLVNRIGSQAATERAFAEYAASPNRDLKGLDLAVSQATLSRILSGKTKAVQWQTFMALRIHGHRYEVGNGKAWAMAVYSPAARRAFTRYYRWLHRELNRIDPTGRRLGQLLRQLQSWDDGTRSAWQRIEIFRQWLQRQHPTRGATPVRHRYAAARVLEPLLIDGDDGGLERTAEEMHAKGDLDRYIATAIEREKLLLKREPDERRVQMVHPFPEPTGGQADTHRKQRARVD